jgi:hypothetical protein
MNIIYVIVFIVIITLLISWYNTDSRNRAKAYKFLSVSSGVNDESSKKAKITETKVKNKTSKDDFLKARVEHLNERNEPVVTPKVIENYTRTLERLITEDPNEIITVGDTNARDPNIPTRDFITDAIGVFTQQIAVIDDPIVIDFVVFADQALPLARHQTIAERKYEAKVTSANKEQEITQYLDTSKAHTNDPQNAHDIQVNSDVKKTFDLIENDSVPFHTAKNEILDFINNNKELSADDKQKAIQTLSSIEQYNRSVSVLNGNEKSVLQRIWGRTNAPGNEANSYNMKLAAVKALRDSVEKGVVLCPNGVTSRLLESPILLDKNESVGKINTFETVKNMIFDKAHAMIKNEIENAKKSDNEKIFAVGMYYENPDIPVDENDLKSFESDLKKKLDEMLYEEAKQHNINEQNINTIREQLHASVS